MRLHDLEDRNCEAVIVFLEAFDPRKYYPFEPLLVAEFVNDCLKEIRKSKMEIDEWVKKNETTLKLKVCEFFLFEMKCTIPECHEQMLVELKWGELFW
jgi:hypothetical protein